MVASEQLNAADWQHGEVRLVCVEKWQETHDVVSFRFHGIEPVKFNFKPGQFLTFILDIDGETVYRSYTISSSPSRPYSLVVTIKRIPDGVVSNYLCDKLDVGHSVRVTGPDGVFNLVDIEADKYLFLSAGSGITPMYSMSRWLTDTQVGSDVAFVHSARSPEDVIFKSSLEAMNKRFSQFELSYILDQGAEREMHKKLESGRLDGSKLEKLVPDYKERTVFVCGPAPYMAAVKEMLEALGFDMSRFHQESFGDGKSTSNEVDTQSASDSLTEFMLKIGDRVRALKADQTVLDGIEAEGLPIIAACRSGVCGACKCQVVEGETESTSQMALTPEEIANGYVLACSTKLKSDIKLQL